MPFAALALALAVQGSKAPSAAPPALPHDVDLAHDLGVGVSEVKPCAPSAEDRKDVAARLGCTSEALAGAQLFRASTLARNGRAQPCTLVAMPLDGAARGGRVVFSVFDDRAHELGLWGALDFDADPSVRWSSFAEQLRVAGTNETGATVGAFTFEAPTPGEVDALVQRLAKGSDDSARLARALLRQRLVMRRNGMWLASVRRGKEQQPAWPQGLARDLHALAELSPDLAPVLGKEGAARHAAHARELAGILDDWHELLVGDPGGDTGELQQRMLGSCRTCHDENGTGGKSWKDLCSARRATLGLAETRFRVGLDLAPAIGDEQGVSQEIATKVAAGILLAETLAR